MRSDISTASSMLCVTSSDRGDRHSPLVPQVEQVGAQGLGGQHVQRRERLVHQQHGRMHDQRARQAHALAHAAGELLRIGAFVAVEPDQIDGRQRPLVAFGRRDALRLQPDLDVLQHREPGEQREGLEHHRDFGRRARRRGGRRSLTSPALAGMRPAMMRSRVDLPLPERPSSETISLPARARSTSSSTEHVVAAALGIVLADAVDLEQRRRSDPDCRRFHDGLLYSRRKRRSASR